MRTVVYWLLLLFYTAQSMAVAQSVSLQEANDLYKQKKYSAAIIQYKAILKQNPEQAELCYNLANAYYKNNELGKAILYYEKCLYYQPSHKDAANNLKIANRQQADKLLPVPKFPFIQKIEQFLFNGNKNKLPAFVLFFCWAALLFGLLFLFAQNNRKIVGLYGFVGCTLLAVLFFYFARQRENKRNMFIAVSPSQQLYISPNENSKVVFVFHEGMKYSQTDSLKGWYKIALIDGKTGWINKIGERI